MIFSAPSRQRLADKDREEEQQLPHRNIIFIPMEYDLPIPEGKVMLTSGLFRMHLVADGVDQTNGKTYVPISKVPFWGYLFAILDLTMCLIFLKCDLLRTVTPALG